MLFRTAFFALISNVAILRIISAIVAILRIISAIIFTFYSDQLVIDVETGIVNK